MYYQLFQRMRAYADKHPDRIASLTREEFLQKTDRKDEVKKDDHVIFSVSYSSDADALGF